jgi:acyl-coenzyme A synthetase/AMP-(fatty) acid ligase
VLYLCGRSDTQVNLNGNRLNLMEIEGHLRLAPGVKNAAAIVAARVVGGRGQLMALVEAAPTAVAGVRASLRETLPAHMIPAVIVPVAELPRPVLLWLRLVYFLCSFVYFVCSVYLGGVTA